MFKLTPKGVEGGKFLVKIEVDTHSGNLGDLDLQRVTTLHVDSEILKPIEPINLGGHHSGSTLIFEQSYEPSEFEIRITGVRQMGDLVFRWP